MISKIVSYPKLELRFDRRREPRFHGDREVIIRREGDDEYGIAVVKDWSVSGLRIEHTMTLHPKDRLVVITPEGDRLTIVVWCRKVGSVAEAGLAVLSPAAPAVFNP